MAVLEPEALGSSMCSPSLTVFSTTLPPALYLIVNLRSCMVFPHSSLSAKTQFAPLSLFCCTLVVISFSPKVALMISIAGLFMVSVVISTR